MFKELSKIAKLSVWQIAVSEKNGIMTVTMVPQSVKEAVHPITLTGSPEEIDKEFPNIVDEVVNTSYDLVNMEDYKKSLKKKDEKEKPKKKEEEKKEEKKSGLSLDFD